MEFLENLILLSEKSANIARAIRQECHLLSLLVQEKKEGEKNPRFVQDFKTLADVLVQEVVRHDLEKKFPDLVGHIHGEESNEFQTSSGEMFYLHVGNTKDNTSQLLNNILCDDIAADMLATIVHSPIAIDDLPVGTVLPKYVEDISLDNIAVWIDPIDSTGEYINAESKITDNVSTAGLPCVTVLIGAFLRSSGEPVAGVINQPFHSYRVDDSDVNKAKGHIVWGCNYNGSAISSVLPRDKQSKVVVVSTSENESIRNRLIEAGLTLLEAAGAGYKLLCVIEGIAGAYILSKGTTFFWDTCSCDGILRSLGGGILDYTKVINGGDINESKIIYSNNGNFCNSGGIIAYIDEDICDTIIKVLSNKN